MIREMEFSSNQAKRAENSSRPANSLPQLLVGDQRREINLVPWHAVWQLNKHFAGHLLPDVFEEKQLNASANRFLVGRSNQKSVRTRIELLFLENIGKKVTREMLIKLPDRVPRYEVDFSSLIAHEQLR